MFLEYPHYPLAELAGVGAAAGVVRPGVRGPQHRPEQTRHRRRCENYYVSPGGYLARVGRAFGRLDGDARPLDYAEVVNRAIGTARDPAGVFAGGGQGEDEKSRSGFGGGGGGGTKIEPAAFIIIDDKGVSLLPVAKGKWDQIIDAIPGIAKKISKLKDKLKKEKTDESEDEKTPSEEVSDKSEEKS